MIQPAVVLLVICAVISGGLAATYGVTSEAIAAGELKIADGMRAEVLQAEFEPVAYMMQGQAGGSVGTGGSGSASYPAVTELFRGTSGGQTVGYVATAVAKGYGGDVKVIVGVGADDRITGVRIASHSETPGLGANSAKPEFYSQFDRKDALSAISVVKTPPAGNDIAAISGATITSTAVNAAVKAAIEAIRAVKAAGG
jgi:electron transport complex protein RnfG